jgi:hypothetical protein
MIKLYIKTALLLIMPMLLSGCITGYTVYQATHEVTLYRHEDIKSVEKVVQTQDAKLIALFYGKMAGSSKAGPFMVTIPLNGPGPWVPTHDIVTVPRNAITEGWCLPEETSLLPIPVVFPVILPGYESSFNVRDKFPGLKDRERTLYVVWCEKHDLNAELVYVVNGGNPSKTYYCLATKYEKRAHKYPLLLLLPFTVAGDIVTLPIQAFAWLINPDRH